MSKSALAALFVAAFSLLAPVSSAMQVPTVAPVVWETADGGNGHTYLFVPLDKSVSWSQANAMAQAMTLPDGREGYLATITSREERAFIRNAVLPENDWSKKPTAAWIGGENEFLIVNRGQGSGHGPKHWGSSEFKFKGWHWSSSYSVWPESWNWSKWRHENEPHNDFPIHKRFLTKWIDGHDCGHGNRGDCNHGHPGFSKPKIIGMIVEWDTPGVPEPATALLGALGIALLGLRRLRC